LLLTTAIPKQGIYSRSVGKGKAVAVIFSFWRKNVRTPEGLGLAEVMDRG
jgi:hypothetical protein